LKNEKMSKEETKKEIENRIKFEKAVAGKTIEEEDNKGSYY